MRKTQLDIFSFCFKLIEFFNYCVLRVAKPSFGALRTLTNFDCVPLSNPTNEARTSSRDPSFAISFMAVSDIKDLLNNLAKAKTVEDLTRDSPSRASGSPKPRGVGVELV